MLNVIFLIIQIVERPVSEISNTLIVSTAEL